MHKVKSAFLWGVGEDASYLADHIATRMRTEGGTTEGQEG